MRGQPSFYQIVHIKVPECSYTAEQVHRPVELDMKGMLEHALQRRKSGAATHQYDRTIGFLA